MQATLIQAGVDGHPPNTNLYRLDEPYEGFEYVCVMAFEPFEQSHIVGTTDTGFIESETVVALWHRDTYVPHADVLDAIGYTIEEI